LVVSASAGRKEVKGVGLRLLIHRVPGVRTANPNKHIVLAGEMSRHLAFTFASILAADYDVHKRYMRLPIQSEVTRNSNEGVSAEAPVRVDHYVRDHS
jgi:hypothetical protein